MNIRHSTCGVEFEFDGVLEDEQYIYCPFHDDEFPSDNFVEVPVEDRTDHPE